MANGTTRTPDDERKAIISDVEKIMKFFIDFRINLASITHDKTCPEYIKTEFSTEIMKMGEAVYPFVSRSRQEIIEKVLGYFGLGNTDSVKERGTSPCRLHEELQDTPGCWQCCIVPCRRKQNTAGYRNSVRVEENTYQEERASSGCMKCCIPCTGRRSDALRCCGRRVAENESAVRTLDSFEIPSTPVRPLNVNQEASQTASLLPYPGHDVIKSAIPYTESFLYKNGGMTCNIRCTDSNLKTLEYAVERQQTNVVEKRDEIEAQIQALYQHSGQSFPSGDLLHLTRSVTFDISRDPGFFQREPLERFSEYVNSVVNSPVEIDKEFVMGLCERSLQDMEIYIYHLRNDHKQLLESNETNGFLKQHTENLRQFIAVRLRPL